MWSADTPKQDACYCEFYWAVQYFVVRDTATIPYYFTVVRNTVAIKLDEILLSIV